MKKTSFKKTYYALVKRKNLGQIKTLLREQTEYEPEIIDNLQFKRENKLPYLFGQIESSARIGFGNYGVVDGNFVSLGALMPQWPGWFYLPLIFFRRAPNPKMQAFVEARKIKEHELDHLVYLLNYIDANPSYIERAKACNVSGCAFENLEKSIQFEIEKVFRMEAPTLAKDYRNGENTLALARDGVLYEVLAPTEERFVKYQVGQYLSGLLERYLKRFPEHKELIGELYRKEVEAQARTLFGEDPMEKIAYLLLELWASRNNPRRSTKHEIGDFD